MIAIVNSRFFKDNQLIANETVLVNGDEIVGFTNGTIPDGYTVIDAEQNYLTAGFIDLQIYGAGGRLFSADPTVESLNVIEHELLQKGTTGFLICVATNTPKVFNDCISAVKAHRNGARNCLGIHLEGPFLNTKRRGAHIEEYIRPAGLDEIKALIELGDGVIKMITIAPELQDDTIIAYLLANDIVVSLGHSNANFDQATAAYNMGIQTTTHLFNAMAPLHHREPGIPTAVFNHDKAMASIIVDGHHVDFEVVKFSQKILKERLFLITDAVTSCSTGPYQHHLSEDKYVMPDGTLSGSSLSMLKAVKNCVVNCDIDLEDALKMGSEYPAKLMGHDQFKGKIAIGQKADLIILDNSFNIKEIIFGGEKVNRTFQH